VRDAVVDLFFVRIGLGVALADTLCDHAGIALGVASVLAVLALHTCRVLEEIPAKCAAHNVVELVLDKFVAVHLVNLLLALTNGTLSTKAKIDGAAISVGFDEAHLQLDLACRL
jgi:hypothetical protein